MNPAAAHTHSILRCQTCHAQHPIDAPIWACPCGGLLDVEMPPVFPTEALAGRPASLWRYREALPLHPDTFLMTSKDAPKAELQRAGHGQMVETPDGEFYHTHLTGRPLAGGALAGA